MGKAQNRDLEAYFLRAAGVAAVWIDADGCIGAQDVAPAAIEEDGRVAYCCARGAHFVLAYRLQMWLQDQPVTPDQATIGTKLEEIAEHGGVGITPHPTAAARAAAAVASVEAKFEAAAARGDLREVNQAFKAARAVDPSLRYADFIKAKKAAMLEALATGGAALT